MIRKTGALAFLHRFTGVSWRDLAASVGPIVLLTIAAIVAAFYFVRPAPPGTIIITAGPVGSTFHTTAEKYQKILKHNGMTLEILDSGGSLENLKRLADPSFRVDIGFVQGGVAAGMTIDRLVSLGSIFHEPLAVYYRSPTPLHLLSELKGKRLGIGPEGSGTRALALTLLKTNGIEPDGKTIFVSLGGAGAAQALIDHKIDAAFLMGDSATPPIMRQLFRTPGVRLLHFSQADAYARRYRYLNKLELPMGVFDFGKNMPPQDVYMIGPTVELIARDSLHPALSDLLIEAARQVHGGASLLQKSGEFPAPLEHEFRISEDASRYYKSGKGFLYRSLPFWVASLADRLLLVVVPVIVLLIPGLRLVPWLYSWRVRSRIYRWYGTLIALERNTLSKPDPAARQEMQKRLDEIESAVNKIKVPLAFADQFYVLREHIRFVRERLTGADPESASTQA